MKKSIGYGRGSVYTIILKALQSGDKYGYEICKEIEEKSNGAYILKQPSLYSGLKRLEAQKDVYSYWGDSDIGGRRHYYSLTEKGKERINRTNFSWEDARADVLGDLFELTDEEKTVKSIKQDVNIVNSAIQEINDINNKIDEQIIKNQETNSKLDMLNNNENLVNKTDETKIQRHLVNENQQDLFSLFTSTISTNIDNQNIDASQNEQLNSKVEINNEDAQISKNNVNENYNNNNNLERDFVTLPALEKDRKPVVVTEIINDENHHEVQKDDNNDDNNIDAKNLENQNISNQKENQIDGESSKKTTFENNNIKTIKTETSAINVQDYLNSKKTSTLFDEEIVRTLLVKPQQPIDSEITENSANPILEDDDMEKRYQDFLKAFEVDEKDNNKKNEETNKVANENIEIDTTKESNHTLSQVENSQTSQTVEDNQQVNNANSVTFYNLLDNNNEHKTSDNYDISDAQNLVFNEDFEVIDKKEKNINISNTNVDVTGNNANTNINSITENDNDIRKNESKNDLENDTVKENDAVKLENKPYPVEVKQIFGDLIEETNEVSQQEIDEMKNSIIAENQQKTENEFATNDTKQIFEDYNKTNFKTSDELPRVNLSNNINLSLNSDDYKQETKIYKSPFKSYHDDEPSSEDVYEKMYEKAYKERFENNEKYNSLNANTQQYQTNEFNPNNYEINNIENVPFDQKFASNYNESSLQGEDYVVRRFNTIDVKNKESKYFNIFKFKNINNIFKIIMMLIVTLSVNLISIKLSVITKFQQYFLTTEYCLIGIYLIFSLCYAVLHKNQRKINNGSFMEMLKLLIEIISLIADILVNVLIIKINGNIFNVYATLIIPGIVLVLSIIFDFFMLKVKKSSFLYK